MSRRFSPGTGWWLIYIVYRMVWVLGLPAALAWLWHRGRREPGYRQHWAERLGHVDQRQDRPVWVHAASLGEIRGAAPLLRALCGQGLAVRLTTLTPAGRMAAHSLFAQECSAGRLEVVYAPVELAACVRRFIARTRPRCAVMMENDLWPVMLVEARRSGLPLAMANAQYSQRSQQRDERWFGFRSRLFAIYDLVIAKSQRQADRFKELGADQVQVGGEIRFDLPVPEGQLEAAAACVRRWSLGPGGRPTLTVASAVEGEEALWLGLLGALRSRHAAQGLAAPLFVVVPRSPSRFDAWASLLQDQGWRVARRSQGLDANLQPKLQPNLQAIGHGTSDGSLADAEVLLGDSLGEMFFYLALADAVAVGGSFLPSGSHNVIEPLSLGKPVVVGPVTWTIEFPAEEALAAKVLHRVSDPAEMVEPLMGWMNGRGDAQAARRAALAFAAQHGGASTRHLRLLLDWMAGR